MYGLVRGLRDRNVATVLFSPAGGELLKRAAHEELPVKPLPAGRNGAALAAECRARGAVLLHAHDSRGTKLGLRLKRATGLPLVLSRRVASPLRRNPFSRRKYSASSIDAVIAISETVRDVFAGSGYPRDRIAVALDGLDVSRIEAVNADFSIRAAYGGDHLVAGIGKLSRKKNWPLLIQAAQILKGRGARVQWLLIGDGPQRDTLEREAARRNVRDCVHFLGFRQDALAVLKAGDLLFFPSLIEGASVTVREAMLLEVPVVAVNAAGTAESLAGCGWLIEPDDPVAAADAVAGVLSNPEAAQVRCREAHRIAADRYSLERTVEATLEVYNRLLQP